MGFCSLQHLKESKVHFSQVCLPASFHLQGLVTLLAVYSLRIPAGFVSHRRRSWDSPFGDLFLRKIIGVLPPDEAHIPFNQAVFPPPKRRAGPKGLGSWVFALSKVPGRPDGFLGRRPLEPPMGFALPGFSFESLGQDFARPPLTRFARLTETANLAGAPEYQLAFAWFHP
jgi:hypothetical protein